MATKKDSGKPVILLLGKIPPPWIGPAIATQHILASGLNTHFHILHQDTRLNREVSGIGKWHWQKPLRQAAQIGGLTWKILRYRPELVWIPISQSTGGFLKDSLFIATSRLLGCRVLLHLRGSDFRNWLNRSSQWTGRYVRFILHRCRGVIVLGECLRHLFEGFFPLNRIFVVPNGAEYVFPAKSRNSENVRILYLANLMASKGIEDVIEAVSLLVQRGFSGFQLDVVGAWAENDLKVKVLDFVDNRGLPVTIHASASGNKKSQFFADADIFVFPPRAPEGHPWVIVEALAAGLPVVTTDQGAIKESVIHGENGFLVPVENPEAIALKLQDLIGDVETRRRMGEYSRVLYQKMFSESVMVRRLKETLNKVMER